MFVQDWDEPAGGIHGYLKRFLASGDATFQHIAIWTLVQLLESEDRDLKELILQSKEIVSTIRSIAEKNIESDDESDDGEAEVVQLARRASDLLNQSGTEQNRKDLVPKNQ